MILVKVFSYFFVLLKHLFKLNFIEKNFSMFKKEREFNIITGEELLIPMTKRSFSCSSQLENYQKTQFLRSKVSKLGVPKDKN